VVGAVGIVTMFVVYFLLQPLNPYPDLAPKSYHYQSINITPDNTSATFRDEGKSQFFIHPGVKKPTGVLFTFDEPADLVLQFSIVKGSEVGDILFTILKNGKEIKKFIVVAHDKEKKSLKLSVNYRDQIGIWADKHGSTAADWGYLEIKTQQPLLLLKNLIIPFLWALLFVFLLGEGHMNIAINAYIGFILMLAAEKLTFGPIEFNNVLTYMLLVFSASFLFTLFYQELSFAKRYKVATVVSYLVALVLYGIPLSFIVYALNYHMPVNEDALFAVFNPILLNRSNISRTILRYAISYSLSL